MPKHIKPQIEDPIEVVKLQFDAGPDAPKDKQYTSAQIFEAGIKRGEKMHKLKNERNKQVREKRKKRKQEEK